MTIKEKLAKIAVKFPVEVVKARYLMRFGRLPNIKSPHDLNEKILYLKLFGDTSMWTRLADKYLVREYVADCGCSDNLIPLLGVWDDVEKIDFGALPEKCMMKANNGDGKGTNMIFCRQMLTDGRIDKVKETLRGWINASNIGALSAEPQYRGIPPRIIAEEYLPSVPGESSLVDYKIWCFNGKPYSILCCSDRREDGHLMLGYYDLNWKLHPEKMQATGHHTIQCEPLPKPSQLDRMIEIARKLSSPFQEVRVDLYQYKEKVYFGELTFTSLGGMMNYYTPETLLEMGDQITL